MDSIIKKYRNIILLLSILLSVIYGANAQEFEVFLFEDFENGGLRPSGWTEQYVSGSRTWRFENGGYAPTGAPTFRHPPNAYSGEYNALFQDESIGPKRKLITPALDLRTSIKPTLIFWHAQDVWTDNPDELKIYYSITKNPYTWVQIEHYNTPVANWTEREIILPDAVKVQECFIAFEGISNWGWGVCVDDVTIEERGLLQRTVETFSVKQQTATFPSGSKINPFAFIRAYVSGNNGEIPVNSIQLDYTGTDIANISNTSIYHTRDSLFSITSPVESSISYNGNEITITAPTFNLLTGDNYIWICFDIEPDVSYGTKVDFTMEANSVLLGQTTFPTTAANPIQYATIHESLLLDDFQDVNGWVHSDLWEIGAPTGLGSFDPNYAYSGTNVLATNLSGNYPASIPPDNPQTTTSSSVDAKFYQNLTVVYKRWLNIEYFDKTSVCLSNNGEVSWNKLFESNSDILDRRWRSVSHNIASLATRKEDVKVRFSIDTTNQVTEYGGWNIDDFAITGEFIHSDVGVKSKILPVQTCGLTNAETVKVVVKNYGGATVDTDFEVGYSLNGGVSYTREWFTDPIESEDEVEFEFTTPANLSSPGLKNLVFRTYLTGDQDVSNNAYSQNIYVFPTVSFPYETSFESSTAYWYPSGTNSSWQWGTPSGECLNIASQGTKAWVTNLSLDYKNNEFSYLESPCFDLTTAEYPVLSFNYMMEVEEGADGMLIEYSIDGGSTWNLLPENENYASNWFDTPDFLADGIDGWSSNKSTYTTAKTLLPNDAIGINGVKFRFVFVSNTVTTFEGVALDMIRIYELPYDLGITSLISPTDDCEIGIVSLDLQLTNFGYRPVPVGLNIPVKIMVDNGTAKSETLTYNGAESLAQLGTFDFTTTNTFNITSAGIHDIIAYTNLTIEDNRLNDTLTTTVDVYGIPEYSIGPDIGTMQPDTIVIDAGQGYESYEWYEFNDPDWDLLVGEETYQYSVPVDGWGSYSVLVENSLGCTATDTIIIAESDKDVGVTDIINVSSECTNPDDIYPQVNLKFFGLVEYDGIETIPIKLAINGEIVMEELVTPNIDWGEAGRTDTTYVFASPINLSEVGEYQIAVYTDLFNDLDRLNDTISNTYYTWGEPNVETFVQTAPSVFELASETLVNTSADTLVFQATEGFISYNWEQQILGQTSWTSYGSDQDFYLSTVPNNLVSAYYRVSAEADHGCGFDTSVVFVNAADLAITSIDSPVALACQTEEPTPLLITIKNVGFQTYDVGTEIDVSAITPFGEQNETITLTQQLLHNQLIQYQFPEMVQFPIGEHYITFTIESVNDPNTENNAVGQLSTVNPTPWVTLEPDTLFRIFGASEDYTISPTYSEDVTSYEWHDGTLDPDYLIWGPPLYSNYKVVAKNTYECSASDSLIVVSSDLEILSIESPMNDCVLANGTPVTFILYNNGNTTYPIGSELDVVLYLDGNFEFSETIILPVNLGSNSSTNINLNHQLDLEGIESATVEIVISTDVVEVYDDNNTLNKTVYALGYPTITLGEDREVHAYEEILDPGYFEFYEWQDESAESTFTATEDGTYSVTVTDFTGCQAYAEVTLTFFVDDIGVTENITPETGCSLSSSEPVEITIANSGTYSFPAGTSFDAGFTIGEFNHSETITLDQPLNTSDELTILFTETADLSAASLYTIEAWVDLNNDMVEANNTLSIEVESYPEPDVSFNLSNPYYTSVPFTLYAGTGFVSYTWQDDSDGDSFYVTEPGTYSVTVIDENGCEGYEEIEVIFMRSELNVTEIITPAEQQCNTAPMYVEVTITNERTETLTAGSELFMRYQVDGGDVIQETYTLTEDLGIDETLDYRFSQNANLTVNNSYDMTFRVDYLDMQGNTYEHSTTINPKPTVNIGPDTLLVEEFPYTIVSGVGSVTYEWSTGATTSSITVFDPGTYWIVVTNTYGCTATDTIYLDYESFVQEIPGTGSIVSVFPNPVKNRLMVDIQPKVPGDFIIEFVSPLGQRIYQRKRFVDQPFTHEIDVSTFPPGMYVLRVSSGGKWVTLKVIVEK